MKPTPIALVACLLVISIAMVGCDTAADSADRDGEAATTLTEDGTVPDDFPNDVPLYEGTITRAFTSNDNMTVSIETAHEPSDVYAWCLEEIEDEGWNITAIYETDDGGTIAADKGDRSLQYTITSRDEGSGMVVFTGPKAE
ncbi:MAG: hypothetical protein ACYC6C_03650 [Coriobacteriia bacterium]